MSTPIELSPALAPALQRWNALAEIALIFGLFVVYLWGGRDLIRGASTIFVISMLALLYLLHRRTGETPAMLGLRWDTFGAAMRRLLPIMVPVVIVVVTYSLVMDTARFPPWPARISVLLSFIGTGLLQQYVLLGFFARRFTTVFRSAPLVILATASVFAALHLPNVFLTVVTFIAGVLCVVIYQRAPNLFATGITHGVLSFVISLGLPLEVNDAMRVGAHHIPL